MLPLISLFPTTITNSFQTWQWEITAETRLHVTTRKKLFRVKYDFPGSRVVNTKRSRYGYTWAGKLVKGWFRERCFFFFFSYDTWRFVGEISEWKVRWIDHCIHLVWSSNFIILMPHSFFFKKGILYKSSFTLFFSFLSLWKRTLRESRYSINSSRRRRKL